MYLRFSHYLKYKRSIPERPPVFRDFHGTYEGNSLHGAYHTFPPLYTRMQIVRKQDKPPKYEKSLNSVILDTPHVFCLVCLPFYIIN
nr:MAG TPA: hypothetical protein [Caudoviricetes sp.]